MDITFLVGNGFDLSLGYRTAYDNFYRYYDWASKDPVHQEAIDSLKASIKRDIEKNKKLKKESNWVDFEIGLGIFTKEFNGSVDEFIAVYNDAVKHLCKYLESVERKGIAFNCIKESEWDEIRKNLCYFFMELENYNERSFFVKLKQITQGAGSSATFHFVSFNYTNFLDKCVEKLAQKPLETWSRGPEKHQHVVDPEVYHVHGTINDFPVVGVSDEEQILKPEFRTNNQLRTIMIKPNEITEFDPTRANEMNNIIQKSSIICLWGSSLGASDKHWWIKINEWLKNDTNRHIFIFKHTDSPPPRLITESIQRKIDEANHLLCYSDYSDEEKQGLMDRIHVIYNTEKVLVFSKIYKPNLYPSYRGPAGEKDNVQ